LCVYALYVQALHGQALTLAGKCDVKPVRNAVVLLLFTTTTVAACWNSAVKVVQFSVKQGVPGL
jgi:hypothetical protein